MRGMWGMWGMRGITVGMRSAVRGALSSTAHLLEALLGSQRPSGATLQSLLHEATEAASSPLLKQPPSGIDSLTEIGMYDGALADILATAKYRHWPEPLENLGVRLGQEVQATSLWLSDSIEQDRLPLLVPVPSPKFRSWNRGLDHTAILAAGVASVIGLPVRSLVARSWILPQMQLGRASRAGVGGSLRLRRWARRSLRRRPQVLIVDDVMTTGATLSAMAGVLRQGGAQQVHACVVAAGRRTQESIPSEASAPISWGVVRG